MSNLSYEERLFNAIKNGQAAVKSVYDIWLELGNQGTADEFLNSLKGTTATVVKDVTIPTSAWTLQPDGLYYARVNNANIAATNVVNVSFHLGSILDAANTGVLGYTNTFDGGFDLFANFASTKNLVMDYAIIPYV